MVLKNTVIVLIISLQQCYHWLESINTHHPDISREIDPIISRKWKSHKLLKTLKQKNKSKQRK